MVVSIFIIAVYTGLILMFAQEEEACVFFDSDKMFVPGVGKVGEWKGCTL